MSQTTTTQATVPVQQGPVVPAPAPSPPSHAERGLDTQPVPPPAVAPTPTNSGPIFETKNRGRLVRTPSDENLPKWVPVRGRLSVVESSDLAENLGLVPPGTTKKTDERISVADKLAEKNAEESAARAANAAPAQTLSSYSYAPPGRVRSRR